MKLGKNLRVWLSLLVVVMLLSACGQSASTPAASDGGSNTVEKPAEDSVASADPVSVVLWSTGSEDEAKVLEAAAKLYMEKNANVTIEVLPISWDDGHAKVLTAATGGTGPDIVTGGLSWGIEFGEMGGMIDLRDYSAMLDTVTPVVHEGVYGSVVSPDGSVYGVPWDLTAFLMFYRPDVLEEVGAAVPPTTWEEMTDAIDKLQDAGKSGFAMQWGNTQWLQYFNYLYAAGGTLYSEGCKEATVNGPEGVEALTFYASLYNDYSAPTDGWPDLEGGMNSEDYGFGTTGSWVAGNMDASYPEMAEIWKMAKLPAGPTGKSTSFIGGRIIGIMSYSKVADTAADFIGFLYTPEAVEAMTKQASDLAIFYIPPRVDFADKIDAPADRIDALKSQLNDAIGPPNCTGWEESARTLEAQIQEVIFNGADPQAALDIAAETMNTNLNP